MGRKLAAFAVLAVVGLAFVAPASASDIGADAEERVDSTTWPTSFPLPNGFRPEGIAIGVAPTAYFGSLADGSIYQVDLRSGEGSVLSVGPGTPSVGLKVDFRRRLFVSGGAAGNARVVDARNGNVLKSYQFATGNTFVNDVVLTHDAAWFTDSFVPVLYKLPLGWRGDLPSDDEVVRVPLSGDLVYTEGFNANGIVTSPDGRSLIVVTSNTGKLYRVEPDTGVTHEIDVGGETLPFGDGLLREGRRLYVVQNRSNQIAVIDLDRGATKGKLVTRLGDPRFDIPPTVASFGRRLYLPNARFTTTPTPTTTYNVVAIDKP